MKVYFLFEFYDDNQVMEVLLFGEVQLVVFFLVKFEFYMFKYCVFGLLFLFLDMRVVDVFVGGDIGQKLLGVMFDYGFVGFGYIYNGLKQFMVNKFFLFLFDVKGFVFCV